jgi:hypothetical protein
MNSKLIFLFGLLLGHSICYLLFTIFKVPKIPKIIQIQREIIDKLIQDEDEKSAINLKNETIRVAIEYKNFTIIQNQTDYCQIINENYKFEQIEINEVKYPVYDYDTLLTEKYNYSCLNRLSKEKKNIYYWYKPNQENKIGYRTPIENCPINNCEFHYDFNRINQSDAVLVDFFNLLLYDNITSNEMNKYRNTNQKWVKYSLLFFAIFKNI